MNWGKRWPPPAQHRPGQQPTQPNSPGVLQPKAAAPQVRLTPAAPPVYRPQPIPKCLQPKTATPRQTPQGRANATPPAPPVYRPQPTPKGLQRKPAYVQPPRAGHTPQGAPAPPARGPVIQRMVLSIGNIDKTIEKSEKALLGAKGGESVRLSDTGQPLARLQPDETLYINAHGSPQTLGGMSPQELVKELLRNGLPANYQGKIYLHGCNSATDSSGASYAQKFQTNLAQLGVRVRVKGNKGFSNIDKLTGKTSVIPHDKFHKWTKLNNEKKELEELAAKYKELLNEKDLYELVNQPKQLGKCEAAYQWVQSMLAKLNCYPCGPLPPQEDEDPLLFDEEALENARNEFELQKLYIEHYREKVFKRDKHLRPTLPAPDPSVVHKNGPRLADMYRRRLR